MLTRALTQRQSFTFSPGGSWRHESEYDAGAWADVAEYYVRHNNFAGARWALKHALRFREPGKHRAYVDHAIYKLRDADMTCFISAAIAMSDLPSLRKAAR